MDAKLTEDHKAAIFSKTRGTGSLTADRFLRISREHTYARLHPEKPVEDPFRVPSWMTSQIKLKIMEEPKFDGMPLREYQASILAKRKKVVEEATSNLRQLEIVNETQKENPVRKGKNKNIRQLEAVEAPAATS